MAGLFVRIRRQEVHVHMLQTVIRHENLLWQQKLCNLQQLKNRRFHVRTAAHIFVSPGDVPAIITQYVA